MKTEQVEILFLTHLTILIIVSRFHLWLKVCNDFRSIPLLAAFLLHQNLPSTYVFFFTDVCHPIWQLHITSMMLFLVSISHLWWWFSSHQWFDCLKFALYFGTSIDLDILCIIIRYLVATVIFVFIPALMLEQCVFFYALCILMLYFLYAIVLWSLLLHTWNFMHCIFVLSFMCFVYGDLTHIPIHPKKKSSTKLCALGWDFLFPFCSDDVSKGKIVCKNALLHILNVTIFFIFLSSWESI